MPVSPPLPGEIQVDHYSRVFPTLSGTTEEKNAAILAAWDQSEEAKELDDAADRKFPAEKFSRAAMVPVFMEHKTVRRRRGANGEVVEEPVVWDRDKLARMCYAMNHRVLDTGSFSPICEGHTPDKHARDKGCPQPEVLGYQGKCRLGMIGNKDPKWAIFVDEYRFANAAEKFEKLTRRSPEVWTSAEEPFFDPCAALGAETPRLDMGTAVSYSQEGFWEGIGEDGATVDKYSMGIPAFAGSGNVAVPSPVKSDYQAGQQPTSEPDGDEGSDAIVAAVLDALSPLIEMYQQLQPLMPALQSLALKAELPPKDNAAGAAPDAADTAAPVAPAAPVSNPTPPNPQPQAASKPDPAPAPVPKELDDADKNMMTRYMAGEVSETDMRAHRDKKNAVQAPPAPVAPQSAPATYSKVEAQERYERLNGLRDKGYEFELQAELKLTESYSREQFDNHCSRVVTRYSRLPIGAAPLPVMTGDPSPQLAKTMANLKKHEIDEVAKYALDNKCGSFKEAFDLMYRSDTSPVT